MSFFDTFDPLQVVNHRDLDKTNNTLTNLEWMSYSDNTKHYLSTRDTVEF